jgi:protease PrsW
MESDLLLKALIAIAPVLVLLMVFDRLDVFNLISLRDISLLVLAGGVVAGLSLLVNGRAMDGFPIGFSAFSRYVSPLIEETLKAAPICALFYYNRLGFKLDAAIAGFALGAGFSVAENLWFLFAVLDANVSAWLVRGFGTAIMHGGATAIFAVIAHEMTERQAEGAAAKYSFNPFSFLPGLGAAIVIHSTFNHFPNQPVLIMALTLLLVPVTLFLTLARSERATSEWLKSDEAAHRQALDDIRAGRFAESEAGKSLHQLTERLGHVSPADAFAYLELKTELVLRAEELIRTSMEGAATVIGDAEREKFAQLDALEQRLGRPVVNAISSRLGFTRNDLWELGRLRERAQSS